jgi:hypothetical protein
MQKTFRILDIDFKIIDKNKVEVINPDQYAEYLIKASDGIRANIYASMKDIIGSENMPDFIDIKVGKTLFKIGYNGALIENKKANINEIIKKIAEELKGEPMTNKSDMSTEQQKNPEANKEKTNEANNEDQIQQIKEIEKKFLDEISKLEQEFSRDIDKIINEAMSKNAGLGLGPCGLGVGFGSEFESRKDLQSSDIPSSIKDMATPKFSDVEKSLKVIEEYLSDINDPIVDIAYDRVKRFLMSGIPKETDTIDKTNESISVNTMLQEQNQIENKISANVEYINKIIKIAKELAYEEVDLDEKKIDNLISVLNESTNLNLENDIKEMINELKNKLEDFKKKNKEQENNSSIKTEKSKEGMELKEKASIKKKSADVKEEFKKIFEEESSKTNDINEAVKNTVNKLKNMGYDIKTAKDIRKKRIATFKVGEKVWLKEALIKDDTNFGIIKAISGDKAIVDWGNEIPTEESLNDLVKEDDYKIDFNINLFANSSSSNSKIIRKDSRFDSELFKISFKDKFNDIQKENNNNRIKIGKFEGNIIKDNDGKFKIQIGDRVLTFFKYQIL